jgi:hypothetical protein
MVYNGGFCAFRGNLLQDDGGWLFRVPNGRFWTADNSHGDKPENSLFGRLGALMIRTQYPG